VGVPSSLNIRFSWSSTSEPGKSGRPALANSVKIKNYGFWFSKCIRIVVPAKIHPADHMSMEVVYNFAPKRTSGGRYQSVTTSAE
jgi:hypothetical protein